MLDSLSRRSLVLALLAAAAALPAAGCGKGKEAAEAAKPKPYEGQYKNAKGAVVLELKEGRAIFKDPATKATSDTSFSPAGENKMLIESSAGTFTLTFAPPDTVTGLPPAIAGDPGPLKKVQ
jgi:hypothetical protein